MTGLHEIMAFVIGAVALVGGDAGAAADSMPDSMDPFPPSAEPSSVCTATLSLGSATSCKPKAIWSDYAAKECAARGYTVTGPLVYRDACWKGFRSLEYTCCN